MGLFDFLGFGESDASRQRQSQIQQYFMQQMQQQQQNALKANQAAYPEFAQPAAPTPAAPAPEPVAAPTPSPVITPAAPIEEDPNKALGAYRDQLMAGINSQYGPGYSSTVFQDSAADPIVDAMLGRQRSTAAQGIERARSRGQLNQAGYGAAQTALGERDLSARSDARALGSPVLARYRQNIDDTIGQMRGAVGTATPGYDLTPGQNALNSQIASLQGSLAGDLSAAIGDRQFYDLPGLLGRAGAAQGTVNPGKVAATTDTTEEDRRKKQLNQVF